MANKPFSIQESKLRIAGVDLEAGNTGVVIPGVTRATSYKVEEVNDTGDQTYQFAPDTEGDVVVIDAALYNVIIAQGNESGFADYTVTTDGEGFIDEIKVNGQGSYTQLQATEAETSDMYAYVGEGNASDRPLVPQDWIQVPFRPRMRAGAIETIGGGGGGGSSITNSGESFTIDGDGNVIFDGPGPGGVNRGMEWQYGVNQDGVNSRVRQDNQGLTVRAWTENGGGAQGFSAPVNIVTNQDMTENRWTFDGTGILTLPVGGDIVDSNGTSVLGGSSGAPTVANTIKGWYSLQGRRPNNQNDAYYQSVTEDNTHIYTLGRSEYAYNDFEDNAAWVQKIEKSTGNVVWAKRIVAGHNATFEITIASGVVSVTAIFSSGLGYQAGETLVIKGYNIGGSDPNGNILVRVDTVDEAGAILTASVSEQPTTPGADGIYNAGVYNNNNNTEPHSIAYDFDGEQIVVLVKTFIGQWSQEDSDIAYADVYVLDALTGAVNNTYTLKDLSDLDPVSIAVSPTGGQIAVVGEKFNEYRTFGTLSMLATGNGYFDILKSNLDPEHYPGSGIPGDEPYNFYIQGTGIAYQRSVDYSNYYQSLPTTTREGSGATFNVIANDGDPGVYSITVANGGSNYLVGHKIKLLGTDLGGTTPANDIIVTVSSVDSGVIVSVNIQGTANGGALTTYMAVSGTNYQVGSGAQVNVTVSPVTGLITGVGTASFGDFHYVVGDVLTVSGTNFANGATPANDITLTVTDTFVGGPNGYTYTGTVPDNALRITVSNVDFTAGGGSWSMRQTLGGETFIWTPTWNKAIGSSLNDYYNDVAFSQDGQSIYAVGSGQYEVNYQQALAVKFNASNGNIVWSKYLNSYLTPGSERPAEGVSVVALTNGNVIVGTGNQSNPDTGNNEITLVCLDTNGTLVWAKSFTDPQYGMNSWFGLSRDGDNAVYITYQSGTGNYSDAYNIIKVNGITGSRVWARGFSNGSNGMYLAYDWGNNFATASGTDIYVAGYTYVPNDNYYSALLWKFPTDGFRDFNDAGYRVGQQFGDFRIYELDITDYAQTQAPQTFTPTVHTGAITTTNNAKLFVAQSDNQQTKNTVVKMTLDSLGYVEFGDGSKQSFATNIIPQILGSNNQQIKLSAQDSGKHFFFDQNCNGATITIPPYDLEDFPVGYTVTIVNCSRGNVFVQMQNPDHGNWWWGTIQGSGRNLSTRRWGIPDSGSGSLVTLMKVKNAEFTGGENESGVQWIIAGPSDLFDDN